MEGFGGRCRWRSRPGQIFRQCYWIWSWMGKYGPVALIGTTYIAGCCRGTCIGMKLSCAKVLIRVSLKFLPVGKYSRSCGYFSTVRHRFDVQSIRDPVPGLVDVGRILNSYLQRILALAQERRFYSRQQMAWKRGEVSTAVAQARSMLFLCYGNINRSALADVMVRAYAKDSGISVASAGFHQRSR